MRPFGSIPQPRSPGSGAAAAATLAVRPFGSVPQPLSPELGVVAAALAAFSAGLVFNGAMLLLNRAFFSLQSNWLPTAIALAKKYEHGFKHTAIIHSRNVETITRMGREMDTSLYIQNGPSMAGLGSGGEGYLSFSIATPTGEGVTTPLTFTRQRRSTTVKAMRAADRSKGRRLNSAGALFEDLGI